MFASEKIVTYLNYKKLKKILNFMQKFLFKLKKFYWLHIMGLLVDDLFFIGK